MNGDYNTIQHIISKNDHFLNIYLYNNKNIVRFIQAIKKGNFKFAQSIMHNLLISCENANKIMELHNGKANNVPWIFNYKPSGLIIKYSR